jgi:hypothetical protein
VSAGHRERDVVSSSRASTASSAPADLAFDDETNKVTRMSVIRGLPKLPVPHDSVARHALAEGLRREESTVTRALDLGVKANVVAPAALPVAADTPTTGIPALPAFPLSAEASFTTPSLPLRLSSSIVMDDELDGATLARPVLGLRPNQWGRPTQPQGSASPILVQVFEPPPSSRKVISPDDEDPSEPHTLARPIRHVPDEATQMRHDALPLPAQAHSGETRVLTEQQPQPRALASGDVPPELKATADVRQLHAIVGEPPAYTPAPFDSVPPQGVAIRTPMSMVLAPEDNATRVGPLATPMMMWPMQPGPMQTHAQMMQAHMQGQAQAQMHVQAHAHAHAHAHQRAQPTARIRAPFLGALGAHPTLPKAIAFASGAILVASIVFILLRAAPTSTTASVRGSELATVTPPEATAVAVLVTPPVQHAPAPPPVAALPSAGMTTTTPAPPTTGRGSESSARAEAPRRKLVSRPPTPKVSIPLRREQ